MDLGIKGKKALVMGGSTGLGRAIAESLIAEGAEVAICARDEKRLKETAQAIRARAIVCDLSKPGAGKTLVERAVKEMGGVDILVTNTGGPPKGDFLDVNAGQWQEGFQGLFLSVTDSIFAALPAMKQKRWGRILLVTSAAAREAMPKLTISNGLRAGLLGLTKSLSNEIAAHGITINALLPGFTDTDRLRELGIPMEKMTSQVPAGRLGEARELGDLAAFLASAKAGYITGQAIAVDGGYLKGI